MIRHEDSSTKRLYSHSLSYSGFILCSEYSDCGATIGVIAETDVGYLYTQNRSRSRMSGNHPSTGGVYIQG